MALSEQGATKIGVVDCDLTGKWGSSERNAGGVRASWGTQVNIDLSKASIAFYESVSTEVGFQQKGYLWLYEASAWPQVLKRTDLQREAGLNVELLSPGMITQKFPFLDRLEDIHGATFSPQDGLINPNLLKEYYRSHTSGSKVDWIDHQVIESITVDAGVHSIQTREVQSESEVEAFLVSGALPDEQRLTRIKAKVLINAAGCWAPQLAEMYGKEIPSKPLRRQVVVMHCQALDLSDFGMMVDASGLYFHHEAGNILAGYAVSSEKPGYAFEYEGQDYFMKEIWPRLVKRSSGFERLKLIGGWAGLYAVSPDKSAIIGAVSGLDNVYEAHSFSGHGVMQSYAVGRGLAELILKGQYQSLDLGGLSGERFTQGDLIEETLDI